jgi:putative restriction endonuclease
VLCLCPNDHVCFEFGSIVIEDDLTITDTMAGSDLGSLRVVAGHEVNLAHLSYHRECFDLIGDSVADA